MGGNLVAKMAGELAAAAPPALRAVCAVCPAIDLATCADALERWDNYPYQRHFVSSLMSHYSRKQKLFPWLYSTNGLPPVHTVRQFDDFIIAPRFGYRDAQDYTKVSAPSRLPRRSVCLSFSSLRRTTLLCRTLCSSPQKSPTIRRSASSRRRTAGIVPLFRNTPAPSASGPSSASWISVRITLLSE